jgi:hypothetical protein
MRRVVMALALDGAVGWTCLYKRGRHVVAGVRVGDARYIEAVHRGGGPSRIRFP